MDKIATASSTDRISVLLIDDDMEDIFITSEYLSGIKSFQVNIDKESNYKNAEAIIAENRHDLYLVDYLLGPKTGIELIKSSIENGNNKPFILLTGKGYHTVDMEAAKLGAYDYLIKGEINSEVLERSIRYSRERYKAYASLRESETRYKEIFLKSKEIIFLTDVNGNFIDFNDALPRLLGYSREALLRMNITSLYDNPQDGDKIVAILDEKNEIDNTEVVLRTQDGEKKYFIASGIRIRSMDGRTIHQGLLHDFTYRKNQEKENVLNEKIGAINRLVRTLAHEIRNPLTNIKLSIEQLHTELNDDQKFFSEIIIRNGHRINGILTDLANLSMSDDFEPKAMDIRAVMDKTLEKAIDRFELNEIKLVKDYPAESLQVDLDTGKIEISLLNIIINALEAVEPKKGVITISIQKASNNVLIKVADNGHGISSETVPYLFDSYFTQKKTGMGLGLALSLRIVKMHSGTIEVQSELGKGTEFIIKLPCV